MLKSQPPQKHSLHWCIMCVLRSHPLLVLWLSITIVSFVAQCGHLSSSSGPSLALQTLFSPQVNQLTSLHPVQLSWCSKAFPSSSTTAKALVRSITSSCSLWSHSGAFCFTFILIKSLLNPLFYMSVS